ncbi:MAG: polymer-forming cytoskeletal protein [Butyrivibrio sp.]|nr:polymer-forming cytoskeletal protein [Butyrivibrio sp.]
MGFFSELKSDLSSAVNTISPKDEADGDLTAGKVTANTTGKADEVDLDSMLNRLDNIKLDEDFDEPQEEKTVETEPEEQQEMAELPAEEAEPEVTAETEDTLETPVSEEPQQDSVQNTEAQDALSALEAMKADQSDRTAPVQEEYKENRGGNDMMDAQQVVTDETASITGGMVINGDIQTTGSLDLMGKVVGNVTVFGKLNVNGEIEGDSNAAEVYAESARITGDIHSQGSAKIGQSTVIIGNIYANSAVIAGAIKGDIDVHGPVVLDTTAIVMGNIKSQSVQINNGAVIEGMCSQVYAEVNPSAFFEELKNK